MFRNVKCAYFISEKLINIRPTQEVVVNVSNNIPNVFSIF